MAILTVGNLTKKFGALVANDDVSFEVERGTIVGLIGPNGEQVGVIATSVALNLAKEANLDLVEVAPNAKPPVAVPRDQKKTKTGIRQ